MHYVEMIVIFAGWGITWMICRNSEIEWFVLKLRRL